MVRVKCGKNEILNIKAGKSRSFPINNMEERNSIRSYASQLRYSREKPENVEYYKTHFDNFNMLMVVTAVERKENW